ncbi:MAG TPA: RpiB/LacA/LacB family sugar-phosphate isomerase [Mollicutes bacterium]|nr:RpiB/LacA/LacB family sugar-phosphate isomerase [Mollicutes bacterium]
MKIAIGTDHNGETIKNEIIAYLENRGHTVSNLSPSNTPLDDYTDYALAVSKAVVNKEVDYGVLLCGTGIGMSIAANKVPGIRAAHVSNVNEAALSKEHNNANIITLSTKNNINDTIKMIDVFINTEFKNEERHVRRLNKISNYENGTYDV